MHKCFWSTGLRRSVKISLFIISFCLLISKVAIASNEKLHNVINCEIYDMSGKLIRKFPGRICVFMDDGSLLSAEEEKLIYYDKLRNVLWSKSIHPHHQINMSLDKNSFLIIGSEIKTENHSKQPELVRYDVLYNISKTGEVLHSFHLSENGSQFDKKSWSDAKRRRYSKVGFSEYYQKIDWEMTHSNSFYEIPDNKISGHNEAFKKGNYIVNDISLMQVFVLSSDMARILWQGPVIREEWTMFHDVQVVPESQSIIYYDNGSKLRPSSRLVEYDMVKKNVKWKYPSAFSEKFYSSKMGGVQILDNGNILYNDITSIPVAHEISRTGKIEWTLTPRGDYANKDTREPFQQIKRMNLNEFLKNHRGL